MSAIVNNQEEYNKAEKRMSEIENEIETLIFEIDYEVSKEKKKRYEDLCTELASLDIACMDYVMS